jgi:hypothetical protein
MAKRKIPKDKQRSIKHNLQLPMQSGIIITQAVSSNPHYFHKYLGCTHCLIKFAILVRPINGFLRISSNSKTHRHNIAFLLQTGSHHHIIEY